MNYEFLSLEESGNTIDHLMALRQKPSRWEQWLGQREERVVFYGHDDQWYRIDGRPVDRRMREVLCQFWQEHGPQTTGRQRGGERPQEQPSAGRSAATAVGPA